MKKTTRNATNTVIYIHQFNQLKGRFESFMDLSSAKTIQNLKKQHNQLTINIHKNRNQCIPIDRLTLNYHVPIYRFPFSYMFL